MSTLAIVAYDDMHKAEEIRMKLVKLQREYLIDLEDAVVVTRDAKGKIKLNQIHHLTAYGAVSGGFWGLLIGLLFFAPIFGLALGAATGAVSAALADVGIDDSFLKQIGEKLQPNTSALCVLVRQATPDKVLDELKGTGGHVLQTNLSKDETAQLQAALDQVKAAPQPASV